MEPRHQLVAPRPCVAGGDVRVMVCLLGGVRLLKEGEPVAVRPGGKTEALLATLALRPYRGASRFALLEKIWPDADPALAAQSLHSLVYSLHRRLGDGVDGWPPVIYTEGRYLLNLGGGVDVDTRQFEEHVAGGDAARLRGDGDAATAAYEAALDLYRGEVACAADAHEIVERERLRSLHLHVLAQLAARAFDERRYDETLDLAMRLLKKDPCREDAHRLAMCCYVRRGQRAQAFRQYRLCEEVLRGEFDTDPEAETRELFDRIRRSPDTV